MADTLQLNQACGCCGAKLAVDNICESCTVRTYQLVKHAFGPLNTATLVTACVGLPICVKNCTIAVTDNCSSLTVDNSGTFAVQVDGDALTALQLIDNIVQCEDAIHGSGDSGVMALAVRNDTLAALAGTDGDYAPLQVNASGALFVQEGSALDVSAAAVPVTDNCGSLTVDGCVGVTGTVAVTDNCGSLTVDNSNLCTLAGAVCGNEMQVDIVSGNVGLSPQTSGGVSIHRSLDLDESAETVKGTAGQLYWIIAMNRVCAVRYLKVYSEPCPTVGGACADTPVLTIPIPAHACSKGAGFVFNCPNGTCIGGTGIAVAATTGLGDCDTGAPCANDVVLNLGYK